MQAQDIATALQNYGNYLDGGQISRLQGLMDRATAVLANAGIPLGGGGVVAPPVVYAPFYTATCSIDNDPFFNPGENVVGVLRGNSPLDIMEECRQYAVARFGSNSSYSISDLRVEYPQSGSVITRCDVDNDPFFNPGETILGSISTPSLLDAQRLCNHMAQTLFGSNSSAGVVLQGYAP
jgi:hypothetical protein